MSVFRLACVQVNAGNDLAANIEAAATLGRAARGAGADLIAFPECVAMMEMGRERSLAAAAPAENHPALVAFRALAAEIGAWLLAGSLSVRLDGDKIANRCYLIDSDGAVRAAYDKIHMFDVELGEGDSYRESETYRSGDRAVLAATPWGPLGMTICRQAQPIGKSCCGPARSRTPPMCLPRRSAVPIRMAAGPGAIRWLSIPGVR